jgi:hypothetical protein
MDVLRRTKSLIAEIDVLRTPLMPAWCVQQLAICQTADEREQVQATLARDVPLLLDRYYSDIRYASIISTLTLATVSALVRLRQYVPDRMIITLLEGIEDSPRRVELIHTIIDLSYVDYRIERSLDQAIAAIQNIQSPDERYNTLVRILNPAVAAGAVHPGRGNAYSIEISRDDLTKHPLQALHHLVELFTQPKGALHVTFIGEAGIDAGGLGREFVSGITFGAKEMLHFATLKNGLSMPASPRPTYGEKRSYQELGKLMMFILNASREYPTGMIFDHSFFVGLTELSPRMLKESFDAIVQEEAGFLALVSLYTQMHKVREKDIGYMNKLLQYAAPFTEETDQKLLEDAFAAAELDYDDEFKKINNSNLKQNLAKVQKGVREWIVEYLLRPQLVPLIEIAKGMAAAPFTKLKWDDLQELQPSLLSELVQGRLTKAYVISKLDFEEFSPAVQEWFKKWIETLDLKTLQLFVFAMTGARALGEALLKIRKAEQKAYFHTCFNIAELPIQNAQSQEDLNDRMNSALVDIDKDTYNRS